MSSFVISDGMREKDLVTTNFHNQAVLLELELPPAANDDTWAESPDMEGKVRTRTRSGAFEGTATLWGLSDTGELFEVVEDLEDLVTNTHREKGYIRYEPPNGTPVTYDVESIAFTKMDHTSGVGLEQGVMAIVIAFTCQPYGRRDPRVLIDEETLVAPIDSVDLIGVGGHADAFTVITLTDASGQPRDDIEIGVDEADTPIQLFGTDLVTTGFSGTLDVGHVEGTTFNDWVALCGVGPLEHLGRYKVKVWAIAESTDVEFRFSWATGDGPLYPNVDNYAVPHLADTLVELDLGQINITEINGIQQWVGQIETRSDSPNDVSVYMVLLIPATRSGRALAPTTDVVSTAIDVADDFDQAVSDGTALDTLVARTGETWETSGDDTDFEISVPLQVATRDGEDYHFARLGSDVSSCSVSADVQFSVQADLGFVDFGVLARYVDDDNWVALCLNSIGGLRVLLQADDVGGGPQTIASLTNPYLSAAGLRYSLQLTVTTTGVWRAYVSAYPARPMLVLQGQHDSLAVDGSLESGKLGLFDHHNIVDGSGIIRVWHTVVGWTPEEQHVINPNKAFRLGPHSVRRESSDTDDLWGDIPYVGRRVLVPPATRNDKISRLVVKQSRNDLTISPVTEDPDELILHATVTERVLLTAGATVGESLVMM